MKLNVSDARTPDVKGHHIFSQANIRGISGYSASNALSFGNKPLDSIAKSTGQTRRQVHQAATNVQSAANRRWAAEGITPTLSDHFGVARDALQAMGLSRADANVLSYMRLRQLNKVGIDDLMATRVWGD